MEIDELAKKLHAAYDYIIRTSHDSDPWLHVARVASTHRVATGQDLRVMHDAHGGAVDWLIRLARGDCMEPLPDELTKDLWAAIRDINNFVVEALRMRHLSSEDDSIRADRKASETSMDNLLATEGVVDFADIKKALSTRCVCFATFDCARCVLQSCVAKTVLCELAFCVRTAIEADDE